MSFPRTLLAVLVGSCSVSVRADEWPQWLGPQRDAVWRESGIIDKFPANGPAVRWRTKIGVGYAGPAVVGNRVFVTDRVRGDERDPNSAFERGNAASTERIVCLDEATGKIVWEHSYPCVYTVSYPAGPRCTPTVADGQVFTLGAEGNLVALAAADGKVLWQRDFKQDYSIRQSPTWGFSSHPLVDGKKVITLVGGEGTAVVAFDRDSGKEVWRALSSSGPHGPGYGPAQIIEAAGVRQLIVWLPTAVNSLDPETGNVLWSHSFPVRQGLTVPTPRRSGDLLFLTAFYDGSLMLKLNSDKPGASEVWRRSGQSERNTDALHSIMPTPFVENGHIYGVCSYGELRCLKADSGDRVWEDLTATGADKLRNARWANAFLIKHEDRFFLANEAGDLIIARLTPKGYDEVSRTKLLKPTNHNAGRPVVWSHPAFAHRCVFARNDEEIVCVSLSKE
jgi:outer membrane protein assembly factor BamB